MSPADSLPGGFPSQSEFVLRWKANVFRSAEVLAGRDVLGSVTRTSGRAPYSRRSALLTSAPFRRLEGATFEVCDNHGLLLLRIIGQRGHDTGRSIAVADS